MLIIYHYHRCQRAHICLVSNIEPQIRKINPAIITEPIMSLKQQSQTGPGWNTAILFHTKGLVTSVQPIPLDRYHSTYTDISAEVPIYFY